MTNDWPVTLAKTFVIDGGLYFVFLSLVIFLRFKKYKRAARALACLVTLAFGLHCSPLPALWLSKGLYAESAWLAKEAEARGCLREYGTVVVLGGGLGSVELPELSSQVRLRAAAQYLNSVEGTRNLVLTGGRTFRHLSFDDMTVYEKYIRGQGISDKHRIILVGPAANTHGEAVDAKARLTELKIPLEIVLVTSSIHMPRAAATFRRAGYSVCPLPAAPYETLNLDIFSFQNAVTTRAFLNEAIGIVGYRLRGWL